MTETPDQAAEKVALITEAWATYPGRNADGYATVATPGGEATIGHLAPGETDGVAYVDVWGGPQQGAPQWCIINPPLLVPDGRGDIEIEDIAPGRQQVVRRYRLDPVAAIASAIVERTRP